MFWRKCQTPWEITGSRFPMGVVLRMKPITLVVVLMPANLHSQFCHVPNIVVELRPANSAPCFHHAQQGPIVHCSNFRLMQHRPKNSEEATIYSCKLVNTICCLYVSNRVNCAPYMWLLFAFKWLWPIYVYLKGLQKFNDIDNDALDSYHPGTELFPTLGRLH